MKKLLIVLFVAVSANLVSAQEVVKTTTKTEVKKDCKKGDHCCAKKSTTTTTKVETKTPVKKG